MSILLFFKDHDHSKFEETIENGICAFPTIQANLLQNQFMNRKGTMADAFDKDRSKFEEISGNKIKKSRI